MSITLAMEPEMIRSAKTYAAAHGTTMSQMIRDYIASLVNAPVRTTSRGETFRAAFAHKRAGSSTATKPMRGTDP